MTKSKSPRSRHRKRKTQTSSNPVADDSDIPQYVADLAKQLEQIQRQTRSLYKAQETKQALIALGVQTVVSLFSVWAVASGDRAVVWGYSIAHNIRQITTTIDQCKADWWGCVQLKYKPAISWSVSPRGNVMAMLDLIAWAEGTEASYNRIYTGAEFTDFSRHPDRVLCSAGLCSAAAGRYQFMPATWGKLQSQLNLPDFTPASQDKAAIQLMKNAGCYSAAVRGDVAEFADRCWTQWASLQGSDGSKLDKRQRSHPIATLQAKYQEFLGGSITMPLTVMTMTDPMQKQRRNPVTGVVRDHNGADYACAAGETVLSPIAGTFRRGNNDPNGFGDTWGTVEGGSQSITIGHTRALLVDNGASVAAGQAIAECGDKGGSTGPHLHLEIRRDGQLVDPQTVFKPP